MSEPDHAALSGLIDGALDEADAARTRAILAGDPALRAQYDALESADRAWRAMGRAAAFEARVRWPAARPTTPWIGGLMLLVPVAWAVAKLGDDPLLFLVLNGLSLSGLTLALLAAAAPGRSEPAAP